MALHGRPRGDITIDGLTGNDQFGLRWNRILLPGNAMPAVHLGPAPGGNEAAAASGHAEPTMPAPIDSESAPAVDFVGPAQNAGPQPEAAPSPAAAAPDNLHAPYFDPAPLDDSSSSQASPPVNAAPPAGHLPKSEALIWSGPAIMAFPTDAHPAGSDTAAPDTAGTPGTAELPATPDTAGTPDIAGGPDAIARADLDPVLAAMASGADHGANPDSGGVDISAAFLPPGSSDLEHLPHGLDPGFAFTPQPPLPPPDMI